MNTSQPTPHAPESRYQKMDAWLKINRILPFALGLIFCLTILAGVVWYTARVGDRTVVLELAFIFSVVALIVSLAAFFLALGAVVKRK